MWSALIPCKWYTLNKQKISSNLSQTLQGHRASGTMQTPEKSSSSLRANPFPEVTDLFCRLPLLALLYRLEVVNLGDLMRWWVRQGVKLFFAKLSSSKFSRSVFCAFNLEPIFFVWWEHRLALVALDPPLSVKDFRGANSAVFCSLCVDDRFLWEKRHKHRNVHKHKKGF